MWNMWLLWIDIWIPIIRYDFNDHIKAVKEKACFFTDLHPHIFRSFLQSTLCGGICKQKKSWDDSQTICKRWEAIAKDCKTTFKEKEKKT